MPQEIRCQMELTASQWESGRRRPARNLETSSFGDKNTQTSQSRTACSTLSSVRLGERRLLAQRQMTSATPSELPSGTSESPLHVAPTAQQFPAQRKSSRAS